MPDLVAGGRVLFADPATVERARWRRRGCRDADGAGFAAAVICEGVSQHVVAAILAYVTACLNAWDG